MKKYIPNRVKLFIRLFYRTWKDWINGNNKKLALEKKNLEHLHTIQIEQPIFYNPLAQNKIENIKLAAKQIEPIIILPHELFSFWKLVGNPTKQKGYKTGRNIIGDNLQEDIGGGLCQISGIIYHLALLAGLKIEERFCHTIDLYEEGKRYTPIGTDATVVYGYKDIRFINTLNQPYQFSFEVYDNKFIGKIHSNLPITEYKLEFERKEHNNYRTVDTYRNSNDESREFINQSKYLLPK